jgi:hypothetical protein
MEQQQQQEQSAANPQRWGAVMTPNPALGALEEGRSIAGNCGDIYRYRT